MTQSCERKRKCPFSDDAHTVQSVVTEPTHDLLVLSKWPGHTFIYCVRSKFRISANVLSGVCNSKKKFITIVKIIAGVRSHLYVHVLMDRKFIMMCSMSIFHR